MMDDFQQRVIAAQDLRDECKEYGIRLPVNGDGSVSLFHGTSAEAADEIMKNGFVGGTYFSHAKNVTGYGDEGPTWYANVKNENGRVLEVRVDARCVEFVSSTGEFYCPNAIKFDVNHNLWQDANDLVNDVEKLISNAANRKECCFSKHDVILDKECVL